MKELRRTTCNRDCPDACAIVATVEDGRVTLLQGDPDHPVTQGFLCYRTSHFLNLQYGPERITQPMLRKDGALVPVSWDEALDVAAARLDEIRRESGPAAIFHYRSGGTLGMLGYVVDLFFERLGPVTVKRGDICSGAGDAAQETDFGLEDSNDLFDLLNARHILIWGKNVHVSSPHTLPVLKEAKAKGAGLVLIDPVRHRTATLCERFVQPRPGGDFALAMAVARIVFERGWEAPDAATTCDNLNEFRALAMSKPVEAWCRTADASVGDAEDLARRLHEAPCAILVGWGMGRRAAGAAIVRALDALGAVTGNVGIAGGGVSFYYKRRGAFDNSFVRGRAAAPRTFSEPLFGREVLDAKDPPVRALWVTAGNPVAMLPDSDAVAEAVRTREFSVVVDPFMTDTARLATLVLPTTTLLESDDLLGAYGHHWLGEARPVVPPPPGVRSDLEIVQALAARLGFADAVAGTPDDWKRRIMAPKLGPAGVTLEDVRRGPVRNPIAPKVLFEGKTFPTPTGRANLITAAGLPREAIEPPSPTPDYPMLLTAVSTDKAQSSQWSKPQRGPATVTVHPASAAGIPDGATARLESAVGALIVRVAHDPSQRRDICLMPKGGHYADGRCPNALIRGALTDLGEGAALYDQPVRLGTLS